MTTIVLADDHPMVRQGVRTVLETEPDWHVVGEAADGTAVLDLVTQLKPDILIVDLMMPGLNGIEVTQQIRHHVPQTHVIVFSMHADKVYVREALSKGAVGYVLKESDAAELIRATREVLAGRRYLSHTLAERAIDSYLQDASDATLDWSEMLTARERQVLQLAAQGASNAEIGSRLSISPRTAETHRANLMRKLGLQTQAELLRYAFQHGILPHTPQRDE
jgi:DNA-binding NarL/FixJ family response regulator